VAQIAVYLEPSFDGIGDVLASFGQRSPLGDTAGQIRTFSDDPTVLPLAILNPHKRARGFSSPSLRHTRSPLRVNPRLRIILQVQRFISLDYSLWRWEDLNLRQRAYEFSAHLPSPSRAVWHFLYTYLHLEPWLWLAPVGSFWPLVGTIPGKTSVLPGAMAGDSPFPKAEGC